MKSILTAFVSLTLIILLSGCASIFTKSSYPINFSSAPSEASITITDDNNVVVYKGTTPAVVDLDVSKKFFKKANYIVTFSCAGYDDMVVNLNQKVDGWYFGNLLLGGIIGMLIIDPATGAMYKPSQKYIHADLNGNQGSELIVVDINDVDKEIIETMIRIN